MRIEYSLTCASVLLVILMALNGTETLGQRTTPPEKNRSVSQNMHYEANIVPIKVSSCKIDNNVAASAEIVARNSAEIRTGWMAMIDQIKVSVGAAVKKGDLIATVDTKDMKQQRDLYDDYRGLYENQLKVHNLEIKSLNERRKRLVSLVSKSIIPEADLESVDKALISAEAMQTQMSRGKAGVDATIKDLDDKIKNSNFYSPIDGVITELIADPKSISGKLVATNSALVARVEQPGVYLAKGGFLDTQIAKISLGMNAEVTLPSGAKHPGKIVFISPIAISTDSSNPNQFKRDKKNEKKISRYMVEVEFERSGDILPQGLLGAIAIDQDNLLASQCVPWNAIMTTGRVSSLSVYSQELGWQVKEVALGRRGQYYVEVLTPLPKESIVNSTIW